MVCQWWVRRAAVMSEKKMTARRMTTVRGWSERWCQRVLETARDLAAGGGSLVGGEVGAKSEVEGVLGGACSDAA